MPQNPKENFIELLRELFQLNNSDLDFGIYRILKLRSRDVEEFINNVLPEKLEEVKRKLAERASFEIKRDLEVVTTELKAAYGNDFEDKAEQFGQIELFKEKYGRYTLLKEKLDNARISEELETDVYNELYRFFERYYEEGDFITKPRAGDKTYMIPYDGEEVKLYWANYDQYYIKTGENFRNYVFNNGEEGENKINVEFRIKDAETSVNNNQNQRGRLFIPVEEYFEWNEGEKKLSIYFYYKIPSNEEKETWGSKQSIKKDNKGINEQLIIALEPKINETNSAVLIEFFNKERETGGKQQKLFYYHLNRYTSLNKFDYFIHKDLRKFLTRESDYFLKKEILSINFLNLDWKEEDVQESIKLNVVKAGVIREAALTIINFLSELEDFQRRIFEKKKFVVQNEYALTMDLIPDTIYNEVVEYILNDPEKKQINDWVDLGFIENTEINKEDIESNRSFLVDTRFLDGDKKSKMLSAINNVEQKTSAILVNSENYHILNLLGNKFREKIKCIHIDPPYNTQTSGFPYKNAYQHSSWISMLENRINVSLKLLSASGSFLCHIDENEYENLYSLLNSYPLLNAGTLVWDKRNPMNGGLGLATQHEYVIWRTKQRSPILMRNKNILEMLAKVEELINIEGGVTENVRKQYVEWLNDNSNLSGGEKAYRFIDDDGRVYRGVSLRAPEPRTDEKFHQPLIHPVTNRPCAVPPNGFSRTPETLKAMIERGEIIFGEDETTQPQQKLYLTEDSSRQMPTMIQDAKKGKADLDPLGIEFPYCHPVSLYEELIASVTHSKNEIILDYFAGSGTTGHAALKLNREDNGNRKFILVEMGEYFEKILLKRIKKIVYTADWRDGKPKDKENLGTYSTIINYLKLEQYEDSLNNIVFDELDLELEFEDKIKYRFREGIESSASIMIVDKFLDPFNYQMELLQHNERKLQNVDLITTFNFLLGIEVDKIKTETHQERTYRIITGTKNQQSYFLVWRKFDSSLHLDEERDWIKTLPFYDDNSRKYCNADNAFGAESTEAEFKRLMFEDVK